MFKAGDLVKFVQPGQCFSGILSPKMSNAFYLKWRKQYNLETYIDRSIVDTNILNNTYGIIIRADLPNLIPDFAPYRPFIEIALIHSLLVNKVGIFDVLAVEKVL